MRATHKARESFVADLIRQSPKATVWHATRLMRFGSAVEAMVHDGNFSEVKYHRIRSKITEIAKRCDCGVLFLAQSPTVRLLTPAGKQLGVPTS